MVNDRPRFPEVPVVWLVAVVVMFALLAWNAHLLAQQHRELRRNRAAICLLLDQAGADPATAAEAEPCRDMAVRP